jgi:2-polyprenyl-3-methyl-5-hydroxy-6-metoxy-1,4-benzoquinol methylase
MLSQARGTFGAPRIREDPGRKIMPIRSDPENHEMHTLFDLVDFAGKEVMEIGCGDGRLTWRYGQAAAHVIAIDPFEQAIRRANANKPDSLQDHVAFHHIAFEEFASAHEPERYDLAIFSWSL